MILEDLTNGFKDTRVRFENFCKRAKIREKLFGNGFVRIGRLLLGLSGRLICLEIVLRDFYRFWFR